jgi:ornithine--oxo-acid transaminase
MREQEQNKERTIRLAKTYLAPYYRWAENLVVSHAKGCRIYDNQGKDYIDLVSCYSSLNVGHRHHKIVETVKKQVEKITTSPAVFLTEERVLFAKELVELCKVYNGKVAILNSGAEAVETAIKIIRRWGYMKKGIPKNQAVIIAASNNFHGRTLGAISLSSTKEYKENFGPFLPGIYLVPYGDTKELEKIICGNLRVAGVLVEPIQSEGGYIVPPSGYLKAIREVCEQNNVLFAADEIQTGFARTGRMFACWHEGVRPDLYILGKALGGGFPISAVVGSSEIMDLMKPGSHGSTFGGNPFCCAVARTAMKILKEEKLDERAKMLGVIARTSLAAIAETTPLIKEIRGKGLLIGIELVNTADPMRVSEIMKNEGLLIWPARKNTIRFLPPLTISINDLYEALKRLKRGFDKLISST